MRRGDLWWAELPAPVGARPVVVVSRDEACRVRDQVIVAHVTTRRRGIQTEVPLGAADGLARESVMNADALRTVPKPWLTRRIGSIGPEKMHLVDAALRFALGIGLPPRRR